MNKKFLSNDIFLQDFPALEKYKASTLISVNTVLVLFIKLYAFKLSLLYSSRVQHYKELM